MALSGLLFTVFIISGMTLVQTLTPSELRGRVVAVRSTVINVSLLSGSAVAGVALIAVTPRMLWLIEGSVIAVSSLMVWLRSAVRQQP